MKTIVFLGPTLPLSVAKEIYPEALFHEPVQCGDIIQALRLKPKRILIIDGYYENVPAVWHKEILLAMSEGVIVYGAASMGALRAAELTHFGMQGIGRIYEYYVNHEYDADDEVAVLHHSKAMGFSVINDALVNIRETFKFAVKKSIITQDCCDELIAFGKTLPYAQRDFNKIIHGSVSLSNREKIDLIKWLDNGNKIDIKKEDAIVSLQTVRHSTVSTESLSHAFLLEKTTLLRRLMRIVNTDVFSKSYTHLPLLEKNLVCFKKNSPVEFKIFSDTAFLCSICLEMMNKDDVEKNRLSDSVDFKKLIDWLDAKIENAKQIHLFKDWIKIYYGVESENPCLVLYAKIWLVLIDYLKTEKIKIAKKDIDRVFNQLIRENKQLSDEVLMSNTLHRQMLLRFIFLKVIFFESRFDFLSTINAPLCSFGLLSDLGVWLGV